MKIITSSIAFALLCILLGNGQKPIQQKPLPKVQQDSFLLAIERGKELDEIALRKYNELKQVLKKRNVLKVPVFVVKEILIYEDKQPTDGSEYFINGNEKVKIIHDTIIKKIGIFGKVRYFKKPEKEK